MSQADIGDADTDTPKVRRWRLLGGIILSVIIAAITPIVLNLCMDADNPYRLVLPVLMAQVLMLAIVVVTKRASWAKPTFGVTWWDRRKSIDILGVLAMLIIAIGARHIIADLLGPLRNLTRVSVGPPYEGLLLLYATQTILTGPFIEELFYRAYVQRGVERGFGRFIAVPVQAVLFALTHQKNLSGIVNVFTMGMILGLWRSRRKTLIPLIATHMLINCVPGIRFIRMYMQSRDIKITRQYDAKIEALSIPAGADPQENARLGYERAFESFVRRSGRLTTEDMTAWPTEISDEKRALIAKWISDNKEATAAFEAATRMPYYAGQYKSESGRYRPPEVINRNRQMAGFFCSRAKMAAYEGDLETSIASILTCQRFYHHLTGPKPLAEQLFGLGYRRYSLHDAYEIIKHCSMEEASLKRWQEAMEDVVQMDTEPVDFSAERLICLDFIQRTFTDDGDGHGHIPSMIVDFLMRDPNFAQYGRKAWENLDRDQTRQCAEAVYTYLDSLASDSPARLYRTGKLIRDVLPKIVGTNPFMARRVIGYEKLYNEIYRYRAQAGGFVLTCAIKRYRLKEGHLPKTLFALVENQYLNRVPMDPFTDSPLTYRGKDTDFVVYSVGPDFHDDIKDANQPFESRVKKDFVFWVEKNP